LGDDITPTGQWRVGKSGRWEKEGEERRGRTMGEVVGRELDGLEVGLGETAYITPGTELDTPTRFVPTTIP
jgi:hypothetical protein